MMKSCEQRFPWRLNWNLLRTFVVMVDEGGPTRAEEFLGVAQPTVSGALKRLEESVAQKPVAERLRDYGRRANSPS